MVTSTDLLDVIDILYISYINTSRISGHSTALSCWHPGKRRSRASLGRYHFKVGAIILQSEQQPPPATQHTEKTQNSTTLRKGGRNSTEILSHTLNDNKSVLC